MKELKSILAICFIIALSFPATALAGPNPCEDVICDDGDLCTEGYCDPATRQCVYDPIVVCEDDGDLCTNEYCDPATGACASDEVVCEDDGDLCTNEYCDPATGKCASDDVVCEDDGDLCTNEYCDSATGKCASDDVVCEDDGDPCTDDLCAPDTGLCSYIDNGTCNGGMCWLTGGGVKFEPLINQGMAQHGPKDSLGGVVFPGCDSDPSDGGQWNHIAHRLKLHFQGWTIDTVNCGNVPGIEPGSESPVTPFNFIEFEGVGTLKGIKGNKVDYGTVFFFARAEDRNEPGSRGAKAGEDIDRYFLHVFSDPMDPIGTTLMLIDMDGDPSTLDPITITGGNLQLHISSCDNPPM